MGVSSWIANMKLFVVLSLIAVASAAQLSNVHWEPLETFFTLVEERSTNGSPTVKVTFSDGYTDTLVLSRYHSSEEDRLAGVEECHFIGHLANEVDACVAMTGCVGSEDVDLTIFSTHAIQSSMFRWAKDGTVEVIESPFKNGNARSEMLLRQNEEVEEVDGWVDDGDEMINPPMEQAEKVIESMCSGTSCTSIPATNLLQIRVGYDDGFLAKVGGTAAAENYIKSTMPHIQASYCHKSLGTKIHVQRIGDMKHYSGRTLTATGPKLQEMWDTTKTDLNGADLMVYLGYESNYVGTVGIAWGKVVCETTGDQYKSSINEWRKTHAEAGQLIAHEMGHNLGMSHDFIAAHKAAGCDGTGIMSYGDPPNQWSTCSVKDMQAHYLTQKNNWCMELAPTACDGSGTVPVTVAPATTTTTPAPPSATCDINNFFGLSGINNNITLTISMNGKVYISKLSCKNSICTPLEAGVTNACEYICGNTTCP